jgi:hypothetical protein
MSSCDINFVMHGCVVNFVIHCYYNWLDYDINVRDALLFVPEAVLFLILKMHNFCRLWQADGSYWAIIFVG